MKYVIVLADGMADEPLEELEGKTPLEAAKTPTMEELAAKGKVGLLHTIPEGMKPGSDTANLSVIGYDPRKYYTGRSPLEAISIGADMKASDVCFRINLVNISEEGEFESKTIEDHSSDEITTKESSELLEALREAFEEGPLHFFCGVSYRHALIWNEGSTKVELTPPHNILGKVIGDYLPQGDYSEDFTRMMKKSYDILNHHPINEARRARGLRPANCMWPWGEGTKPTLPSFESLHKKKGAMISAVDLLKGIAIAAEMKSIDVEGATGNLHTNYQGKVDAAISAMEEGYDFVYVHLEAPDECGHRGETDNKVLSIEWIDEKVVKPLKDYFEATKTSYRLAVLPDHPTPIRLRTHTGDAVPFMVYDSMEEGINEFPYSEKGAKASGLYIDEGCKFMPYFLGANE